MNKNPLKYTGLTYNDIMTQVNSLIATDPRFDNFRESAVAQFLVEMFSGVTDITNYYLQRRAEECYFDTAQHHSSVINLSRMFGYDITRRIPAQAKISITLSGDNLQSKFSPNSQFQIPYFAKFDVDGTSYVLKDTMTFDITQDIYNAMATEGFSQTFTKDRHGKDIWIVQGEIKEVIIEGATNAQLGASFQRYMIEDESFSNFYGTDDVFYNKATRIYVGATKVDSEDNDNGTRYEIDRRSLINWESIIKSKGLDNVDGAKVCLVRSTPEKYVDIMFGNGGANGFASLGAVNPEDNVFIQYLSTEGASSNKIGVLGNLVNFSGSVFTSDNSNVTTNLEFALTTNISGGADFEDKESIRYAAPKIYYSLDRLVSKSDYEAYLKTLSSPVDVRNAIAWGEQEQKGRNFADKKSYNAAFFSLVGSLYNINTGDNAISSVKVNGVDLDSAVLDVGYDENKIQTQSFFNVYTRELMAKQVKEYQYEPLVYDRVFRTIMPDTTYDTIVPTLKQLENSQSSLTFVYASDKDANGSDLELTTTIDMNIEGETVGEIAQSIKDTIVTVVDYRGDSMMNTNANYGQLAFPSSAVDVTFTSAVDGTVYFNLVFDMQGSPCFIKSFADDSNLAENLGVASVTNHVEKTKSTITVPINDKIVSVVDQLTSRSQITITNIYMSPLIHSFELVGTVYIKPLYDIEEIRRDVNNSIYSWLDLKADFNLPINKSNIIELVESNAAVVRIDMDIKPVGSFVPYTVAGDNFYDGQNVSDLVTILDEIFTPYTDGTKASEITEEKFFKTLLKQADDEIYKLIEAEQSEDLIQFVYVNKMVVGGIPYEITGYDSLIDFETATNMKPDYSEYYITGLNRIRKACAYNISNNLINKYGNIGIPNDTNSIIGKYSIGSEICKIDCSKLRYVYR